MILRAIRQKYIAWRFRKLTEPFDYAIKQARKRHHPTSNLLQAKRDFVTEQLRRSVER